MAPVVLLEELEELGHVLEEGRQGVVHYFARDQPVDCVDRRLVKKLSSLLDLSWVGGHSSGEGEQFLALLVEPRAEEADDVGVVGEAGREEQLQVALFEVEFALFDAEELDAEQVAERLVEVEAFFGDQCVDGRNQRLLQ